MRYISVNKNPISQETQSSSTMFRAGLRRVFPINETIAVLQHCNQKGVKNLTAEDFRKELLQLDVFLDVCDKLATDASLSLRTPGIIPQGFHIPVYFEESYTVVWEDDCGIGKRLTEGKLSLSSFTMLAEHHRSKVTSHLLHNGQTLALNLCRGYAAVSFDELTERAKALVEQYADQAVIDNGRDLARCENFLTVSVYYCQEKMEHILLVGFSNFFLSRIKNSYYSKVCVLDGQEDTKEKRDLIAAELNAPSEVSFMSWVAEKNNAVQDTRNLSILDSIN